MSAARKRPALVLLTFFAAYALLQAGCAAEEPVASGPCATIRGQRVELELTRTRAEMSRGLGYRDSLAWDHGMLFEYDEPAFYSFWMQGMRFDIDIVWIRDNRIVDISHQVPHEPGGNGPTVRPGEVVDTVLEVPAGYALTKGWRIGDVVELQIEAHHR